MEAYIGTKIVLAEPMDEATFAFTTRMRPASIPEHVAIAKDGKGRDGYKVVYEDGYASWSPKQTFERAHRPVTEAERMLFHPDAIVTAPALARTEG